MLNQLTAYGNETIKYDQNGNRIEDGKFTYQWNAADQLVSVTKKGESTPFAEYKYDDDGRRIQKKVNGTVTNYIYDGDSLNVLYETNANDQVQRSYVYSASGQLLALNKHSGNLVTATYTYHYNPRGDVIALTDQSGNVVASYSYDSWGNPLEAKRTGIALENPFRYAGYQYDEETDLYYLMARYYHPTHGVFLSMDPDPGDDDDILTQNGYAYANNNPVMMVDPDGHWFWFAVNAGFAAYDGYKAYKAGKSKKQIAWAVASGFGPGRYFKGAKRAVGFAKKVHKNSKKSKAKNHLYEIYDRRTGQVVKVGISSGRISKKGKSYRATSQVNKWGRNVYDSRIVKKNINGRSRALLYEQAHVNRLSRKGKLDLSAGKHSHPMPRR